MKVNYKKEVNGYSDDPDAVISSPTMPSRGHSQASSSLQHSSGGGDAFHMAFTPKIRKWALSNSDHGSRDNKSILQQSLTRLFECY